MNTMVRRRYRISAGISCAVILLTISARVCVGQVITQREGRRLRNRNIDWCKRNGVIIKGMSKSEVLEVCGRPDRRFNYNLETGRLERWTYDYPRRQVIVPLSISPFEMRYRQLFFRDDTLVNFHN